MTIQLKSDKSHQEQLLRLLDWLKEVGLVHSYQVEKTGADEVRSVNGSWRGENDGLSPAAKAALEKVEKLKSLQANWDSYNADAPSPVAIASAEHFIGKADMDGLRVYFAAPGRNGEVLVEFKTENGRAAEVYFEADGGAEVLMYDREECVTEGSLDVNYEKLITSEELNKIEISPDVIQAGAASGGIDWEPVFDEAQVQVIGAIEINRDCW